MFLTAAIFDLDGTLIATAPDVLSCLKQALDLQGLKITGVGLDDRLLTPPLPKIFELLVPEITPGQRETAVRDYATCYAASTHADSHPFPGIFEQLRLLQQSGLLLFVASNKAAKASKRILELCHMSHFFTATRHPDSFVGKTMDKAQMLESILEEYALKPEQCIMIGDGPMDIQAAHSAGTHSAAALYGYGPHTELRAQQPEVCLPEAIWQSGKYCATGEPFVWSGPKRSGSKSE